MPAQRIQLTLDFGGSVRGSEASRPARVERRESIVRLVEYAPVPRMSVEQRCRKAVTHDVSASGMCLVAAGAEPVGSLLRVTVRCVDGRPTLDAIARVAWCAAAEDGQHRIGLALVRETRAGMKLVRRSMGTPRIATA